MKVTTQLNASYAQMVDLVDDLSQGVMPKGEELHGGRNLIVKTTFHGIDVVVKKFNRIMTLNRWVYAHIRPSKARRSYDNALRLLELGFATPDPIAMVEVTDKGLLRSSYYACRHCEGERFEHWRSGDRQEERARQLAALMLRLHRAGICHGDFNEGNILLDRDGTLNLIDLNRMRFYDREVPRKSVLKQFAQLNDSSHDHPEELRRLAGIYASLRGDTNPEAFGELVLKAAQDFTRRRHRMFRLKHPLRAIKGRS